MDQLLKKVQSVDVKTTMDRKHAHSVFIGPTGSGKSSLMRRLRGKTALQEIASTGIANKVVVVDFDISKNPTAVYFVDVLDRKTWQEVSSEGSHVDQILNSLQPPTDASPNHDSDSSMSTAPTSAEPNVGPTHDLALPEPTATGLEAAGPSTSAKPGNSAADLLANLLENQEILDFLLPALESHGGVMRFPKSFSLYMRDAGGQVEFQEVVSLLVFGPSIFFFVFRADQDLKSPFKVQYRKGADESLNYYTSSMTLEEALLQSLASVYAMNTDDAAARKSYVFIVATHIDMLGPSCDKTLAKLNKDLRVLIKDSGFESVVLTADQERRRIMFAVNNLSEKDDDFALIRSKIHDLVTGKKEFTVQYPVSYLLFSLELQSDKRSVLSLEECTSRAAKYGIEGSDQIDDLLAFLHQIGVIQYYNVNGLKHIIMKDSQVLFDMATDLIVRTFPHKVPTVEETEDFETKGILSAAAFDSVTTSSIALEDFKKILIHRRIMAPFTTQDQQERYFIPCVLNHVPEPEDGKELEASIPPLVLKFKCKHCPKGLFGVLVTYLMAQNADCSDLSIKLLEDKIFKDHVSFAVYSTIGYVGDISLRLRLTHIEVKYFSVQDGSSRAIGVVCDHLRRLILASIEKSVESLHYNLDRVQPIECLQCNHCSKLHPVKKQGECHGVRCGSTCYTPQNTNWWYNEVIIERPSYNVAEQKEFFISCKPEAPPKQESDQHRKLEDFSGKIEIILQTVNESEYQAAAMFMKSPDSSEFSRAVVYPTAGNVVGMFADKKTALIQTDVGADTGDYVQDALNAFPNAKFVIGVGVCYAFDPDKYKFGDVLVSKKISDLKNSRFNNDGTFTDRGQTVDVVDNLKKAFCMDFTLANSFEVSKETRRHSKVYAGRFISYSVLLDHKETRDKFRAAVPEAIGGEMEGGELMKFERKRKVQGIIVVKGVVDYADGNKEKGWQFTAARAALHYVEHKLYSFRPA